MKVITNIAKNGLKTPRPPSLPANCEWTSPYENQSRLLALAGLCPS